MSEWKECVLGDIAILHYGKALRTDCRNGGDVPVYSSAGLTGTHDESLVNNKGLIVGRKGTVGKVYFSPQPFWCIDTAYYILPDDSKYDFKYLYFLLQTLGLEELNEDSAVPGLNRNTAYRQQLILPSLPEQKAISSVLSSLDDKIDLLHRQNKTLEAMAEILFRQWFVEEAQEDWVEGQLSDYAVHIKVGVTPAKYPMQFHTHYSLPAFDDGMRPVVELGRGILSNKYSLEPWSILVSKLNPRFPRIWPIGETPAENAICSTEFQVFKPINKNLYGYLYYLLKSTDAKEELSMAASGTSGSHQRVRPEDILNIGSNVPSIEIAERYSELVRPGIDKLMANLEQIHTLENLRDTLLPKLMSGEVRIDYEHQDN